MRTIRIILQVLGIGFLGVLLVGLVLYVMICRIPSGYPRRPLTPEEQRQARDNLESHILQFGNRAGAGAPFTWTITAGQANAYLGSLDAIAELLDSPVYPTAEMEQVGFAGPAVAMRDGTLTFMIHAQRYDSIFSVDVAFEFDDRGDLTARTLGMRIGAMPVPQSLLAEVHQRVRHRLAEQLTRVESVQDASIGQVPVARFARLLRNIVGMLDGRYVRPELVWPLGDHRVRVERVEITEGELTLHVVPVRRPPRRAASGPARAGGA
jgi:hypothetical protein